MRNGWLFKVAEASLELTSPLLFFRSNFLLPSLRKLRHVTVTMFECRFFYVCKMHILKLQINIFCSDK